MNGQELYEFYRDAELSRVAPAWHALTSEQRYTWDRTAEAVVEQLTPQGYDCS